MDLVQRGSARQRNDLVLRLGCWMVTLSMVFSLVIQPPKAKAIVAEASLATSVIWAFMQSAGITLNGTGMNSSSWAEGIEPYLREFTEADKIPGLPDGMTGGFPKSRPHLLKNGRSVLDKQKKNRYNKTIGGRFPLVSCD